MARVATGAAGTLLLAAIIGLLAMWRDQTVHANTLRAHEQRIAEHQAMIAEIVKSQSRVDVSIERMSVRQEMIAKDITEIKQTLKSKP